MSFTSWWKCWANVWVVCWQSWKFVLELRCLHLIFILEMWLIYKSCIQWIMHQFAMIMNFQKTFFYIQMRCYLSSKCKLGFFFPFFGGVLVKVQSWINFLFWPWQKVSESVVGAQATDFHQGLLHDLQWLFWKIKNLWWLKKSSQRERWSIAFNKWNVIWRSTSSSKITVNAETLSWDKQITGFILL